MSFEMKKLTDDALEPVNGGTANGTVETAGGTDVGALYYKIAPGDNLHDIAAKYGTTVYKLLVLNPQIENPNLIYAGDTIRLF